MYYHRVWADIDLGAASFNLNQIRTLLPEGVGIMVVALSENWQRVGDMAARTVVVDAGSRGTPD